MKKQLLWAVVLIMSAVCHAEDITVSYKGAAAKITGQSGDSVKVTVDGAKVCIKSLYKSHKLTLRLTGKSSDGQLVLITAGKAKVKLDGLTLTSQEGAPLWLKNKKKVEMVAVKDTWNTLTVTACNDTANHKGAVIWAKDKVLFSGKGVLNVIATGDGCRGIKTKKDITVEELTLNVTTSGNHLGEKPFSFGPPGEFPPFGNDSIRRDSFPAPPGGFPQFGGGFPPFRGDSIKREGMPPFGGEMPDFGGKMPDFSGEKPDFGGEMPDFGGGFAGKHKYYASAKGIEGKQGVVFNGGCVDILSPDDAVNASGTIEFNGADVTARSTGNDAVDANPKTGFFTPFGGNNNTDSQEADTAIVIRGGTVYAWSQVGSPEEGLDCDFSLIVIEGGTVFSVGGGMGEMPSVPTNNTAKQPTVLLIGIGIEKDEAVSILDADGKTVQSVTIPFSLRRSASLVSSSAFKLGSTYTVKTKDYEKTFTLSEPFTVVR